MKSDVKKQLDSVLTQYKGEKNDLIPVLQKAQEKFGYLPRDVMEGIARFLRLPASIVFGVSTFYAQFKFVPMGKKVVRVCRGTACHVRGADKILQEFERKLCIKPGETTEDREYTLETVACIGACALAPTLTVNKDVKGKMTTQRVREMLDKDKGSENE
jgi:NADH-quinone oxidoreductase subunit E